MNRRTAGLGVVLVMACSTAVNTRPLVPPPDAEAISLLGDTLWTLPVEPRQGPRLIDQLHMARNQAAVPWPPAVDQVNLARRTAGIGRLREALAMLDQTAKVHFYDPRVLRYRGEIHLALRELEQARADFQQAGKLCLAMPTLDEAIDIPGADSVQLSSTQFRTFLLLGVTHYLQGEFVPARDALVQAVNLAVNDDDLAETAFWLFFSMRRIGKGVAAGEMLAQLGTDLRVDLRRDEYDILRSFKGLVPGDTVTARALTRRSGDARALYAYSLGVWHLVRGETDQAELWFRQARRTPNWASLPYLAAEVELARLRRES